MNWYKKSQFNEEMKKYFLNFFWENLKSINGNWTISKCRAWKSIMRIMTHFNGIVPNSIGTKQGYFTGTILILLTDNYAIKSGEVGMSGVIYEGEMPSKNWRANSLFNGADPEMIDLPYIKIYWFKYCLH